MSSLPPPPLDASATVIRATTRTRPLLLVALRVDPMHPPLCPRAVDYFLVGAEMPSDALVDVQILRDYMGSDHCPLLLTLCLDSLRSSGGA